MASKCEKGQRTLFGTRKPRGRMERMNVRRWMRDWQIRFDSLGVEVIVADVAQSSVVVNVAERSIVLSPHLTMCTAERILDRLYEWWHRQPEQLYSESSLLVSR